MPPTRRPRTSKQRPARQPKSDEPPAEPGPLATPAQLYAYYIELHGLTREEVGEGIGLAVGYTTPYSTSHVSRICRDVTGKGSSRLFAWGFSHYIALMEGHGYMRGEQLYSSFRRAMDRQDLARARIQRKAQVRGIERDWNGKPKSTE